MFAERNPTVSKNPLVTSYPRSVPDRTFNPLNPTHRLFARSQATTNDGTPARSSGTRHPIDFAAPFAEIAEHAVTFQSKPAKARMRKPGSSDPAPAQAKTTRKLAGSQNSQSRKNLNQSLRYGHRDIPKHTPSELAPSKQRDEFLRRMFGENIGWFANEAVDFFDPITPVLDFIHRRETGEAFSVEDVFLAVQFVPGPGKLVGKAGRKAVNYGRKRKPKASSHPEPQENFAWRRTGYKAKVTHNGNLPRIEEGQQWLRGTEANAARVPLQVAEKLAGRQYSSFRAFRRAFWKAVANDPVLSAQFDKKNLIRLKRGAAPIAVENQSMGGLVLYEIDHVKQLQHGGDVYDLNNLIIRAPLNHRK